MDIEIENACSVAIEKRIFVGNMYYNIWLCNYSNFRSDILSVLYVKKFSSGNLPDFSVVCNFNVNSNLWEIKLKTEKIDCYKLINIINPKKLYNGDLRNLEFRLTYFDFSRIFGIS
jgi:hypothetical protein